MPRRLRGDLRLHLSGWKPLHSVYPDHNADCHTHAHGNGHGDHYADLERYVDADDYPDANPDPNGHADPYSDSNGNPDPRGNGLLSVCRLLFGSCRQRVRRLRRRLWSLLHGRDVHLFHANPDPNGHAAADSHADGYDHPDAPAVTHTYTITNGYPSRPTLLCMRQWLF